MKSIFSVILSFVILFSSMGFTVSTHYCGGKRIKSSISLGKKNISCGVQEMKLNCTTTDDQISSDCCKNKYQKIQIEDDYRQQFAKIDLSTDFVIQFVALYFNPFQSIETEQDLFVDCSPPPLVKDISVLVQAFLI